MADGDFLACYLTSGFMVLSFQKKLIEEVIDTYKKGDSLADDPAFMQINAPKKKQSGRYHLYPCERHDRVDGV